MARRWPCCLPPFLLPDRHSIPSTIQRIHRKNRRRALRSLHPLVAIAKLPFPPYHRLPSAPRAHQALPLLYPLAPSPCFSGCANLARVEVNILTVPYGLQNRMHSLTAIDSNEDEGLDDLEEIELLLILWCYYHQVTRQPRPLPHRQRLYSGNAWVHHILAHEEDCYSTFRMTSDQFLILHQVLVDQYGLRSTNNISSLECLAIFLHIVSGPHSNRSAAVTFCHSKSTISLKFRHALRRIYNLGVDIIKPRDPTFAQPHPKVTRGAYYPWFENCIGALDGTHIRLQVSGDINMNFIGRHMVPTFNVLAVVDFDCRFIFVCSGRPGSMHDYSILQQALVHYRDHFPHPPQDKFYLVDSAYANRPGFLAPYRNTRYHLQHFQHGHSPETMEELFNYRHAQLRCTVERAFGQLKNKFRILKSIPNYGLHTSNRIVIACMALHDFIKDNGGDTGGDWTQTSIHAGNNDDRIQPDLPDLMQEATIEGDQGYMDRLRDMIAASMASYFGIPLHA